MPHVFISYSRKQREYVRRLATHLAEAAGVEIWFDYEIVTGERWDDVVRTKIDTCAALIVVMTPDAESSHWVAEEVARARDQGKELLPLLLEGSPIFGFMTVHHEDVRGERMPSDRFIEALRNAAGHSSRPAGPPLRGRSAGPTKPAARPPRPRSAQRSRSVQRPQRNARLLASTTIALVAIAIALVAALYLGDTIWSFVTKPDTSGQQLSTGSSVTTRPSATTASSVTGSSSATSSSTTAAPGRNVRLSCYNNNTITGLTARACDDARSFGWNVAEIGNYSQGTIPTTTVYFRPGTEEEAAAKELAALLRTRVEPRFSGIEKAEGGLILIITNDYQGPARNG